MVGLLQGAALVSAVLWVVLEAIYYVRIQSIGGFSPSLTNWLFWTGIVSRVANDVFIASLGLLFVLWAGARLGSDDDAASGTASATPE